MIQRQGPRRAQHKMTSQSYYQERKKCSMKMHQILYRWNQPALKEIGPYIFWLYHHILIFDYSNSYEIHTSYHSFATHIYTLKHSVAAPQTQTEPYIIISYDVALVHTMTHNPHTEIHN